MSGRTPPLSSRRIPLLGAPSAPVEPASAPALDEKELATTDLGPAFELASAELGFAAASWLFVERVAEAGGAEAVEALRAELGASFSVLDYVTAAWLSGARRPDVRFDAVAGALTGIRRVLVVGVEAHHLDVLARDLAPDVRMGLLTYRLQRVDWERVVANFGGRVEPVDLAEFQAWSGARSALLTFVYGARGQNVHVLSAFLRVSGPDVRTQFREIIGWDVLGGSPDVYPRYLVETATTDLTVLAPFQVHDPPASTG